MNLSKSQKKQLLEIFEKTSWIGAVHIPSWWRDNPEIRFLLKYKYIQGVQTNTSLLNTNLTEKGIEEVQHIQKGHFEKLNDSAKKWSPLITQTIAVIGAFFWLRSWIVGVLLPWIKGF